MGTGNTCCRNLHWNVNHSGRNCSRFGWPKIATVCNTSELHATQIFGRWQNLRSSGVQSCCLFLGTDNCMPSFLRLRIAQCPILGGSAWWCFIATDVVVLGLNWQEIPSRIKKAYFPIPYFYWRTGLLLLLCLFTFCFREELITQVILSALIVSNVTWKFRMDAMFEILDSRAISYMICRYCHVLVTRHGVWIANWIYWTLVTHNHRQL
jgi:hypothetical protein